MANLLFNNEEQRVVDQIRPNVFREAMEKEQNSSTASGSRRNCTEVTDNWMKEYDVCYAHFSCGRPEKPSQENKTIISKNNGKRRRLLRCQRNSSSSEEKVPSKNCWKLPYKSRLQTVSRHSQTNEGCFKYRGSPLVL